MLFEQLMDGLIENVVTQQTLGLLMSLCGPLSIFISILFTLLVLLLV